MDQKSRAKRPVPETQSPFSAKTVGLAFLWFILCALPLLLGTGWLVVTRPDILLFLPAQLIVLTTIGLLFLAVLITPLAASLIHRSYRIGVVIMVFELMSIFCYAFGPWRF